MQTIQISLPENVIKDLEGIKHQLADLKKNFQPKEPTEFLTRQDVAKMLSVDLSTVHNWTKKGILTANQIGGRVYYIRKQVENSLIKLNK